MIPEDYLNDVNQRLADRAEDVCRHLLAGGKRKGKRWVCGGIEGGPGQSMNVELEGGKAGVWHDAATGEAGNLLQLWEVNRGVKFPEAVAEAAGFMGMLPPDTREAAPKLTMNPANYSYEEPPEPEEVKPKTEPPPAYKENATRNALDWEQCVKNFSDEHAAELCKWRGFSPEFVAWVKKEKLIGVHSGCFAFPVHDAKGNVTRIHYRLEKGWAYHPKGGGDNAPLIIGNPIHATYTLAFESQWDALAILDKLHAHDPENIGIYSAYITRGATSNTNLSKIAIPRLIAFPQNDPPEKASKTTGRTPAEEWLHKLQTTKHQLTEFLVAETPEGHKDANDWIREEKPDHSYVFRRMIEGAENPALKGVFETDEVLAINVEDDPNSLIGPKRRFLNKGGSWVWVGPSGIGKSTLVASFLLHAGCGVTWYGMTFRRPLRIVVIQAENDLGDLAEMIRGAIAASDLTPEQQAMARRNIRWCHETEKTGEGFCQRVESLIWETKADLVCIDPLLSYVGDDISSQKVASQFLRNWLQPVLKRTGAIALAIHHTGKTSKDPASMKGWSDSDFAYLGLGSSELTNWARAISVFMPYGANSGIFRFLTAKRGNRSGLRDTSGEFTTSIFLEHSGQGQGWSQCAAPEIEEKPRGAGRKPKLCDDDIFKAFEGTSQPLRKDRLVAQIATDHKVGPKTVRDAVSRLLLAGKIHRIETTPREGGGTAHEWISLPPETVGKNQMEEIE